MAYQPQQGASNVRIFWITWCCFWALDWLMVPVSLLAILLPVGRPRLQTGALFPIAAHQPMPPPTAGPLPLAPPVGPPAGWYPAPSGSSQQRYWDGRVWQ